MKIYNCILIFNEDKSKILFCKRVKDPYKGLYNLPGGKVEEGEEHLAAAYRELFEETGISKAQVKLFHLMDLTYHFRDFSLEIYVGKLNEPAILTMELNPLEWLSVSEDFQDRNRFAGDQNMGHIVNVAFMCPL